MSALGPEDFKNDEQAATYVLGELARGMKGLVNHLNREAAKNGEDAPPAWIMEHIDAAEHIIHGRRWWLP